MLVVKICLILLRIVWRQLNFSFISLLHKHRRCLMATAKLVPQATVLIVLLQSTTVDINVVVVYVVSMPISHLLVSEIDLGRSVH